MNADTLTLARASSPAMSASMLPPWARSWPEMVLNAFTTCAPTGPALAISSAPEVPSGVTRSPAPTVSPCFYRTDRGDSLRGQLVTESAAK
jgi:hypothetical protein